VPPSAAVVCALDIDARKKATDSIKDSQELWHTKDYPEFLKLFFEPLVSQLTNSSPQFEDSELQKLRHSVLEVLSKLPPNEVLRPYVPKLLELCLQVCVLLLSVCRNNLTNPCYTGKLTLPLSLLVCPGPQALMIVMASLLLLV